MDYALSLLGPLSQGAIVTLQLFAITLVLSIPLGLALALVRLSRFAGLRALVGGYIWLMRGTPLMLQMLFIYFALPFVPVIGIRFDDFPAAIVAFTLNYAAYFAEIYRSGIQSMPEGQYEAARVLGYSKLQTFFKIILPQVVKRILPSVTNEVITLVKDTSLAFTLSVVEMFFIAKALAASQTSVIPLVAAGVFYYVFNLVVAMGMEWVEKRLAYYQ